MAKRVFNFYVYIMASLSGTLYIGVTNNIHSRTLDHKSGESPGFTQKYDCNRLVYYETFRYVRSAIAREKEIKGWSRKKKIALVESINPKWLDLAEGWDRPSQATLRGKDLGDSSPPKPGGSE
jgi:putative endonuclease